MGDGTDGRHVGNRRTANLRTKILDFRGLDSSIISIIRGGILMSIGNRLESSSQAISVGILLAGRLGVTRDGYLVLQGDILLRSA